MKIITLFIALSFSFSCKSNGKIKTANNDKQLASIMDSLSKTTNNAVRAEQKTIETVKIAKDSSYQKGIDKVTNSVFRQKKITAIATKLKEISTDKTMSKPQKRYWTTYLYYYKAIFLQGVAKDDKQASIAINKALETIEKGVVSSEDYALYAACLSFSIQFANMTQLANISSKVKENAHKALALNPKNVRAYYVLLSNNFFTPKMFGGMTKVEEYGIKGLACPNSTDGSFYAPHWGKSNIYKLLIKYYKMNKKKDEVNKIKALAKKEFPAIFK